MNSKIIFAAIFIFFIALAVFGYLQATSTQLKDQKNFPHIEVDPQAYNFGQVNFGQIVKHTFVVKNKGSKVLKIKNVATSCACTTAQISQTQIAPGKTAPLYVTYDTGAMTPQKGKGNQKRAIYIKSNDPQSPLKTITLKAYVQ